MGDQRIERLVKHENHWLLLPFSLLSVFVANVLWAILRKRFKTPS